MLNKTSLCVTYLHTDSCGPLGKLKGDLISEILGRKTRISLSLQIVGHDDYRGIVKFVAWILYSLVGMKVEMETFSNFREV